MSRLSMGVSLMQFVPSYAKHSFTHLDSETPASLLNAYDKFKYSLDDQLGVPHSNNTNWPASCTIWLDFGGGRADEPAPFGKNFPDTTLMDGLRDRGAVPILFVEPSDVVDGYNQWTNWSAGMFDTWIDTLAAAAIAWATNENATGLDKRGNPKSSVIFLRFAQEMNKSWFTYGFGNANNTNTKATWLAAFRYISRRFNAQGAYNIKMFYCPWPDPISDIADWYPGDADTHIIGTDIYPGSPSTTWADMMPAVVNACYSAITDKTIPIIIGETAISGGTDATRAGWVGPGYKEAYDNEPHLRGVTYFHVNMFNGDIDGSPGPNYVLYRNDGLYATLHAYAGKTHALSIPYDMQVITDRLTGAVKVAAAVTDSSPSYTDSLSGSIVASASLSDGIGDTSWHDSLTGIVVVTGSAQSIGIPNAGNGPTIYGVDVAFTSGAAKLVKANKKGRQFALVKATQDDWQDDGFVDNLAAVKGYDMVPGSFHFLVHSVKIRGVPLHDVSASPTDQATYYLSRVNAVNGGYTDHLFALDVENFRRYETNDHGVKVEVYRSIPTLDDVDEFVAAFQAALPTTFLLIYTSPSVWQNFGNPRFRDRYGNMVRLWLANWTHTPDFTLHLGHLFPTIHQYGLDPRITLDTDGDATNLTIQQLRGVANWSDMGGGDSGGDPPPDDDPGNVSNSEIGCPDEVGSGINDPPGGGDDSVISIEDGVYDSVAHTVTFDIVVSVPNQDADVTFDLDTADGTAKAGTNYTAVHTTLTVPAGESIVQQAVAVLTPTGATGDASFQVVLSAPTNAVLGDAAAIGTIAYTVPDPISHPWDAASYNAWPSVDVVYNEFADLTHRNECTAYAAAAVASAHYYLHHDGRKRVYDAHKLFVDAGGPPCPEASPTCLDNGHCCGFLDTTVLRYFRDHGIRPTGDGPKRTISKYGLITAATLDDLKLKIKKSIVRNGIVYVSSIFYSDWNTSGSHSWDHGILPDHGGGRSTIGHSWVIVGWNDDIGDTGIGGWHVQSAHGLNWAVTGRAWLPYDYVALRTSHSGNALPWFRFFNVVPEEG